MHRLPAILSLLAVVLPTPALAERKPPYWASIIPVKARMRTGPGRNFPASWVYQRAGLPVKVLESYPNWRKVADPDGTTGWMQANMIGDVRTAIITGSIRDLRGSPDRAAPVIWRAAPGGVGRVSKCAGGWCLFDVKGRAGYVETSGIWGTEPDEHLP